MEDFEQFGFYFVKLFWRMRWQTPAPNVVVAGLRLK